MFFFFYFDMHTDIEIKLNLIITFQRWQPCSSIIAVSYFYYMSAVIILMYYCEQYICQFRGDQKKLQKENRPYALWSRMICELTHTHTRLDFYTQLTQSHYLR